MANTFKPLDLETRLAVAAKIPLEFISHGDMPRVYTAGELADQMQRLPRELPLIMGYYLLVTGSQLSPPQPHLSFVS